MRKRALYAYRFGDEGILHDYLQTKDEVKGKTDNLRVKKYIERLYGLGFKDCKKATQPYQFNAFFQDMREIKMFKIQEESKRIGAIAKQETEGKKEADKELRKAKEELRKEREEAEKSHLEKVAVKCLFRKIIKLDDELKEAIEGEEDKIISAAISGGEGPIKEYIEAVIEGIKGNREKILKEKTISDEIIEEGIKRFLNQKSA